MCHRGIQPPKARNSTGLKNTPKRTRGCSPLFSASWRTKHFPLALKQTLGCIFSILCHPMLFLPPGFLHSRRFWCRSVLFHDVLGRGRGAIRAQRVLALLQSRQVQVLLHGQLLVLLRVQESEGGSGELSLHVRPACDGPSSRGHPRLATPRLVLPCRMLRPSCTLGSGWFVSRALAGRSVDSSTHRG